jgi:hypothetical protein
MEFTLLDLTKRSFGIEIETFGRERYEVADALCDAGIPCTIQEYNHEVCSDWKIVSDSSVYNGFELVSPPLKGEEGFSTVRKVFGVLSTLGLQVDRRCGFHVHVDANDLTAPDLLCIARRYGNFEHYIDAVMPPSRRLDKNHYCLSMNHFFDNYSETINQCRYPDDFARKIDDRYYKVNICSFNRHGTIEFRQHSGTVDVTKAINWIMFCLHITEDTKQHNRTAELDSRNIYLNEAAATRFRRIIEMLLNGEDLATIADTCDVRLSTLREIIKQRVRSMGYTINRVNAGLIKISIPEGGVGTVFTTKEKTPPNIDDFPVVNRNPFDQMDSNIVDYFKRRAQILVHEHLPEGWELENCVDNTEISQDTTPTTNVESSTIANQVVEEEQEGEGIPIFSDSEAERLAAEWGDYSGDYNIRILTQGEVDLILNPVPYYPIII